ncbi:MAG: amidase [Chloroflexi bacterium]|nr:amidase [Chloroflexota bacterium]
MSTGAPPTLLSIREIGADLRAGRLSASELVEATLARIDETEPRLNAYITVTADHARRQAQAADDELAAGRDRGPLHGIPVALKDLVDTAGIPTTGGSGFLRGRIPTSDAAIVERLAEAGAVMPGKLNLHEFAFGTTSANPHFGAVRNPWNQERSPGGSSGGSAAAVAVGSASASIGSDTGGSIRIPAALCGVVGLMPTYGRVSRRGVLPLSWSLDHVGPLARSVEDAALVLNAIAGHDPRDPGSAARPAPDAAAELGRGLEGLVVGLPRDPLWMEVEEPVRAACEEAVEALRALGAAVREVELPLLAEMRRMERGRFHRALLAEAGAYHARRLRLNPEGYGDDVRLSLESVSRVPATTYINAQRMQRLLVQETRSVLSSVDVLVSPTTECTAPTIAEGDLRARLARLTAPYDVTGIPAISVPCGVDPLGLPIGLMIGARHFDEVTLCRVAHAYEQATPWHRRRPEL